LFLSTALPNFESQDEVIGVAVHDSQNSADAMENMSEFSDLDLFVVLNDLKLSDLAWQLTLSREAAPHFIVESLSNEQHNVVKGLYKCPLLNVTITYISLTDFHKQCADSRILFDRENFLTNARLIESSCVASATDLYLNVMPQTDIPTLDRKFWPLVADCVARIDRGEIFQAIHNLDNMRKLILGPLIAIVYRQKVSNLRRIEQRFPDWIADLRRTVASYDREECFSAVQFSVNLYLLLRSTYLGVDNDSRIAIAIKDWLDAIHLYRLGYLVPSMPSDINNSTNGADK
jgi:hypothetical protein